MKDTFFSPNIRFNSQGILYEFDRPIVMGILNTTPDSFYGNSRLSTLDQVLFAAEKMHKDGATILDIGGYSSRPGATVITENEEIDRTSEAISALSHRFPDILLSIDTFRSNVAKNALTNGAHIVNDISGGQADEAIYTVAAAHASPYILMHMRGTPQNMMKQTNYENLISDLLYYFSERIGLARKAGVKDIIIDPGFGFSKTPAQNYALLNALEQFHLFEAPILAGVSRKSMIYKTLGATAEESLNGTTVLNTAALLKGAAILRVHDVKEAYEAIQLTQRLRQA